MSEKRFYIIVPETVQTTEPAEFEKSMANFDYHQFSNGLPRIQHCIKMESGRLAAQCSHVGRKMEFERRPSQYEEITTIVLSVRNTRELAMITNAIRHQIVDQMAQCTNLSCDAVRVVEFRDANPPLYHTNDKVHTATMVGPVYKSILDEVIGHLPLMED